MAVQQNKKSKSRRNMRRSHDALPAIRPQECKNCGESRLPHQICASCGYYGGRQVIATQGNG